MKVTPWRKLEELHLNMRALQLSKRESIRIAAALLRRRFSKSGDVIVALTVLAMLATVAGCAGAERRSTVILFEEPRIYVHSTWSPEQVMASLRAHGCEIEAGNPVVIRGVGDCHWTSATVCVQNDALIVNGILVTTEPKWYRNVIIDEDGRVVLDAFLPFER